MMGLLCFWIVLELLRYWKRFRAFSSILVSALWLAYTGSYCIIQRCFSERISGLRVYFKNVQLRLFICLVWSSGDVPLVYGSSGRESVNWKLVLLFFLCGTHLSFFLNSLGLFPKDPCCLSPSSPHSPSLTSLSFGFSTLSRHPTTAGAPPPPSNLPNQ